MDSETDRSPPLQFFSEKDDFIWGFLVGVQLG